MRANVNTRATSPPDPYRDETFFTIRDQLSMLHTPGRIAPAARMTYHTYLADQGFIVSVTATGEHLFGERIMAGLAG